MKPLRDYEQRAIDRPKASLRTGHKHPIVMLRTGGGKTLTAAHIVQSAIEKSNRVTYCVPTISLIDQMVKAFWEEGVRDVRVIQADHPMTNAWRPVQVAGVQTVGRRSQPATDLGIVDEAPIVHKSILDCMKDQPDMWFIGLSATPWSKGLGKYYDALIVAARINDLIERGYLSKFRVFAPTRPDLSGVHTVAGGYHEGELAEAMSKPEITADVVETCLALGENRPTLCFGVNRAHAQQLHAQFETAGVSAAYVDSYTELTEGQPEQMAGAKPAANMATKPIWLSRVLWIANDRLYKPGWATQKFKARFGVWAAHSLSETAARPPTAILNWVTSEQIRFALGQKEDRHAA